jgi:hypothetical protein
LYFLTALLIVLFRFAVFPTVLSINVWIFSENTTMPGYLRFYNRGDQYLRFSRKIYRVRSLMLTPEFEAERMGHGGTIAEKWRDGKKVDRTLRGSATGPTTSPTWVSAGMTSRLQFMAKADAVACIYEGARRSKRMQNFRADAQCICSQNLAS